MDRLTTVPLGEVMPRINLTAKTKAAARRQKVRGVPVFLSSLRLQTFACTGLKCAVCGIEGRFFAIERSGRSGPYHLNLYAINDEGDEVLMTKDHRLPKSKGGTDSPDNLQTMCAVCNALKGNRVDRESGVCLMSLSGPSIFKDEE